MKDAKQIISHEDLLANDYYRDLFADSFKESYNSKVPIEVFFSPGRVNIIGEHIDYNGGLVLPAALSIGIYGIMQPRNDSVVSIASLGFDLKGSFSVEVGQEDTLEYNEKDGWMNYVKGMALSMLNDEKCGYCVQGANILYISNLPDGAGLSSSAALEVLTGYMLVYHKEGLNLDRVQLAKNAMQMENEYIKVNCGIMDQYSVAMGYKGHAILLDTRSLYHEFIPVHLGDYSLVIAHTNKKRELSESKYNERRKECDIALKIVQKVNDIEHLVEADEYSINQLIDDPIIKRRALHVVSENERVIKAVKYMSEGDIESLGKLLTESHQSLRDQYEVSGFELDAMVEESLNHPACIGARMTGAGFGGCAIALVESTSTDDFIQFVSASYQKRTNRKPALFVTQIDDGVRKLL